MMPKELKTEAIRRIIGAHFWGEMCRRFDGNTPERVGWVAQKLWEEREHLMEWTKLLDEAEAELGVMQELACPSTILTVSPTEPEARETLARYSPAFLRHYGEQP